MSGMLTQKQRDELDDAVGIMSVCADVRGRPLTGDEINSLYKARGIVDRVNNEAASASEEEIVSWIMAKYPECNQKEVAERLGISEQYLSDLLLHKRKLSKKVALKLGYAALRRFKWVTQ